jgi:hypothetical protein
MLSPHFCLADRSCLLQFKEQNKTAYLFLVPHSFVNSSSPMCRWKFCCCYRSLYTFTAVYSSFSFMAKRCGGPALWPKWVPFEYGDIISKTSVKQENKDDFITEILKKPLLQLSVKICLFYCVFPRWKIFTAYDFVRAGKQITFEQTEFKFCFASVRFQVQIWPADRLACLPCFVDFFHQSAKMQWPLPFIASRIH